jgi:hypothetical protein
MRIFPCLVIAGCLLLIVACPSLGRIPADRPIEVSKEVYDRTFAEILDFLRQMDAIIASGDFKAWQALCTESFIAYNSDPARLRDLSQKPSLKDRKLTLKTLKDYFNHVFIPSRVEKKLDRIEFIERHRVKTITVVNDVPYLMFYLEKDENNQWKLAVW